MFNFNDNLILPKVPVGRPLKHGLFTRGLEGEWLFNEHGGLTLHDSSLNNTHGTITDATWQGEGLSFDGTGDFVDLGITEFAGTNLFADSTQSFTVIASFKTQSGNTGTIVAKAQADGNNRAFQIFLNTGSLLSVNLRGGTTLDIIDLGDDKWHTVAVTWDRTTAKLFCDGLLSDPSLTVGASADENDAENIIIGARTGGVGFLLTGDERYVSIYDRALFDSEIKQLHLRSKQLLHPDPNEIPMMSFVTVAAPTTVGWWGWGWNG